MFQGLSTALTSLYAQRQALETTGNNISNANTEGYTRQRVDMSPIAGMRYASFHSTPSRVGLGVNIDQIARLRDQFLEARGAAEHGTQGRLATTEATMKSIESAFGEPGENGLQAQMAEFWSNWDKVANNDDEATRALVVEQAKTLSTVFNQASSDLSKMRDNATENIKTRVSEINAMAQNIADLNHSISIATKSGASPNELLDQRDLLVSKMSQIADIQIKPTESNSVAIYVGGTAMVRDDRVTSLQVNTVPTGVELRFDVDGDASTVGDGFPANITGGELGGLVESVNSLIPRYSQQLDSVALNLIDTVNTQHAAGQDAAGNPGGAFFTGTSAADIGIEVALDVTAGGDAGLLAVGQASGGASDTENARAMANLASSLTGPDAEYRKLIDILGVETQRSSRQLTIQNDVVNSVDMQRVASSGVNLDEEMTNLIRFQKAYNASAKYLTVMDDALGTLIGMIR